MDAQFMVQNAASWRVEKADAAVCRQRREAHAIGSVWFLTLGAALFLLGELAFVIAENMRGVLAYQKRVEYQKREFALSNVCISSTSDCMRGAL